MHKCVVVNVRTPKPKWYSVTATTEMTKKSRKTFFSFTVFSKIQ